MVLTKEQIKAAALALGPVEREELAEDLLLSIGDAEREAVEAAWLAEARERDAAFARGEMRAKPVAEVIARLTGGAPK